MNRSASYVQWTQDLSERPWSIDLFELLRKVEAAHPELPRLGTGRRPSEEPVRLRHPAELSFAPAAVQGVSFDAQGRLLIDQRVFGLLGPFGPLPTHLTEFVRERQRHHGDQTLQRWMDFLAQRMTLLFYRAWSEAQSDPGDRRRSDQPALRRVGSLAGIGLEGLRPDSALPQSSRLFFAGRLSSGRRSLEGLQAWCRAEFGLPVRIQPWSGRWLALGVPERSRMGQKAGAGGQLGRGAVLGATVWDVQHSFRIHIGPLGLRQYRSFLPGGAALARLHAIVMAWTGLEFKWDLQLSLRHGECPALTLGSGQNSGMQLGHGGRPGAGLRLGLDSWAGHRAGPADANDLRLDIQDRLSSQDRQPIQGGV